MHLALCAFCSQGKVSQCEHALKVSDDKTGSWESGCVARKRLKGYWMLKMTGFFLILYGFMYLIICCIFWRDEGAPPLLVSEYIRKCLAVGLKLFYGFAMSCAGCFGLKFSARRKGTWLCVLIGLVLLVLHVPIYLTDLPFLFKALLLIIQIFYLLGAALNCFFSPMAHR